MKLVKRHLGSVVLLALKGEFDAFVCPAFMEMMEALARNGPRRVVLNMGGLRFINSTALGTLLKARKTLSTAGGELVISSPSPAAGKVLSELGLETVLPLFEDDAAALEHLGVGEGVDLRGEGKVMVHPEDPHGTPLIGRIRTLEEQGLSFYTEPPAPGLHAGFQVRLRFRIPLFRKDHYFEIPAEVTEAAHGETDSRFKARFLHLEEEERASIQQFLDDMHFLRREARKE